MGVNDKAWDGGFKKLYRDESLGRTLGIVPDDTTKQVHIIGILDTELDLALSADSVTTLYIHGTGSATDWMKVTSNTIAGSAVVIDSVEALTIQIGAVDFLAFDDSAITLAAEAGATAGQNVFIKAEDGGAGATTTGGTGASITITAGAGGTVGDTGPGTGADGGDVQLVAGNSPAGSAAVAEGDPGDVILTPGIGEGTGTHGYIRLDGTATWESTSTAIVDFGTSGVSGLGTTVAEWAVMLNEDGSQRYFPTWQK
ncbi:hypothetical protein LCGC14_0349760 [marine sediment metagenome]|uniref:Uncharacterized protein n=1 Tax=marine sediment metagenome TaxID=412755 RepID=A0A0F9TGR3_9ZZZZ